MIVLLSFFLTALLVAGLIGAALTQDDKRSITGCATLIAMAVVCIVLYVVVARPLL